MWDEQIATMETGFFVAAGPKLWHSLPAELRQADISFQRFKQLLKTFLFWCWERGALWLTVKTVPHKFSYLLTYSDTRDIIWLDMIEDIDKSQAVSPFAKLLWPLFLSHDFEVRGVDRQSPYRANFYKYILLQYADINDFASLCHCCTHSSLFD